MNTDHRSIEALAGGGRRARPASGLILALGAALAAAGCSMPTGGILARDVLEIKQMVAQQKEDSESAGRKVEYRLDTLDEKVTGRADQLKAQLDEMDQVIRAQSREIKELRRMVEGGAVASTAAPGGLGQPAPMPAPDGSASVPPTGDPAAGQPAMPTTDVTYTNALKAFNLGRYDEAKTGFEAVLAANVTGDQAIQTRYWLAETCYALNDFPAAQTNYMALIKSNPSHNLAWQGLERLAEISAKQGRVPDALKLYGQIIEKNPGYPAIDRVKEKVAALQGGAATPAPAPAPAPEPAPAVPASPGN